MVLNLETEKLTSFKRKS